MRSVLPLCGAWTLLAIGLGIGSAASAPFPAPTIPFVTVAVGWRSAITQPTQVVVRDATTWAALWKRHIGAGTSAPPTVDFQTEMIIAIFAGRTPPSTALAIARILAEEARLEVQYTQGERRPLPPGEGVAEATPFHIVRVARSQRAVRFVLLKTPPVLAPGSGS